MESIPTEVLRDAKRMGFSDGRLAAVWRLESSKGAQEKIRHLRKKHSVMPVYKRVTRHTFIRLTKTKMRRRPLRKRK